MDNDVWGKKQHRKDIEILSRPLTNVMNIKSDNNVAKFEKKHEVLSISQSGGGIFNMLLDNVLPWLISLSKNQVIYY